MCKDESAARTEAGSGEAAGGDLYPEIDELLEKLAKENVRFGFDEFGTLIHSSTCLFKMLIAKSPSPT